MPHTGFLLQSNQDMNKLSSACYKFVICIVSFSVIWKKFQEKWKELLIMKMDEQIREKLHFVMQMWRKCEKGKINYFEKLSSL